MTDWTDQQRCSPVAENHQCAWELQVTDDSILTVQCTPLLHQQDRAGVDYAFHDHRNFDGFEYRRSHRPRDGRLPVMSSRAIAFTSSPSAHLQLFQPDFSQD